jgi:hypothetical protein
MVAERPPSTYLFQAAALYVVLAGQVARFIEGRVPDLLEK